MNPRKVRLGYSSLAAGLMLSATLAFAPQARAAAGHVAAAPALPPFTLIGNGGTLEVLRTGTHVKTGSLKVPSAGLEFGGIASDGTASGFLVAVQTPGAPSCDAWFYRTTLSAAGKPSPLKLLRSVHGRLPTSMAASPGGSTITYSTVNCAPAAPVGSITAITKTGTRSWTYSLLTQDYPPTLSVSASGWLAFPQFIDGGNAEAGLMLNTVTKSGTVTGASKVVLRTGSPDAIVISPDGKTLYAHTSTGTKNQVASYSASTGKLIKVMRTWTNTDPRMHCYLSADATGKYLLVDIVTPSASPTVASNTLVGYNLSTGAATTLPSQTSAWLAGTQITW